MASVAEIARREGRSYITQEDVSEALEQQPADQVRMDVLAVIGKQTEFGANDMAYDPAALKRARTLYPKTGDECPYATTPPENICSAYRGAKCGNGFPTNPGCVGKQYLPVCLDEDLCGELHPETGAPAAQ